MNLKEHFIDENLATCEMYKKNLSFPERSILKRLRRDGIQTQSDFNTLTIIAIDCLNRLRRRNLNCQLNPPFRCPKCNKLVVWVPTYHHKNILINADSYKGESLFSKWKNICHWDECSYCLPSAPREVLVKEEKSEDLSRM